MFTSDPSQQLARTHVYNLATLKSKLNKISLRKYKITIFRQMPLQRMKYDFYTTQQKSKKEYGANRLE